MFLSPYFQISSTESAWQKPIDQRRSEYIIVHIYTYLIYIYIWIKKLTLTETSTFPKPPDYKVPILHWKTYMSWVMYSNDVWENAGGQTYTPQVATSTASRCHWFTIESGLHPTPSRCLVRRIFPIEKTSLVVCWPCPQNKNTGSNYTSFCWEILKGITLPFFVWSMVSSLDRLDKVVL